MYLQLLKAVSKICTFGLFVCMHRATQELVTETY